MNTQAGSRFCKGFLKRVIILGLVGTLIPTAGIAFEIGYNFEPPSVATNVQDVLGTNTGETYNNWYGPGYGPTLSAAAAYHQSKGLDFINQSLIDTNLNYASKLRTLSTNLTFPNAMTVALWFKAQTNGGMLYCAGGDLWPATGTTWINLQSDGKVRFGNYLGSGEYNLLNSSTAFSTNQWYHLAVTWDDVSDTLKMYKDGVVDTNLLSVTTLNGGNAPAGRILWGHGGDLGAQFYGYEDDLYLADQALPQAEIQKLMINIKRLPSGTIIKTY